MPGDGRGPLRAAPTPRADRVGDVERDDRARHVLGVQVQIDDVRMAVVVHQPRACLLHPSPSAVGVGQLEHAHVAAVAAGASDLPPCRGLVLRRRHDFDEGVAECIDRVAQAEVADTQVIERIVYAEVLLERRCRGIKIDRRDHCLTKPGECHAPDARDCSPGPVG